MPASQEILGRVTQVLVNALGVDGDDIKPSTTLLRDLGVESIDFLDITFRLEHEFGIKIPSGELFPEQGSPDARVFSIDGQMTEEGQVANRMRMHSTDLRQLEQKSRLSRVDDLYTVDCLANYIEWKLGRSGRGAGDASEPILVAPSLVLE